MSIEKDKENISQIEELKQHFKDYLKDIKFGDVKFQALYDFITLDEIQDNISIIPNNMLDLPKEEIESHLRIDEIRLALLSNQIDQKKGQMAGYYVSNLMIEGMSGDVYTVISDETNRKHPNDKNLADIEIRDKWIDFKSELVDILFPEIENPVRFQM